MTISIIITFIILKEILVWYFCILCVSICDNPLKIHRIIAHQPPCCISDALYHWCIRFSGLPMAFCQPPLSRVSLVMFFRYFCITCVSLLYHCRVIHFTFTRCNNQLSQRPHWFNTIAIASIHMDMTHMWTLNIAQAIQENLLKLIQHTFTRVERLMSYCAMGNQW